MRAETAMSPSLSFASWWEEGKRDFESNKGFWEGYMLKGDAEYIWTEARAALIRELSEQCSWGSTGDGGHYADLVIDWSALRKMHGLPKRDEE